MLRRFFLHACRTRLARLPGVPVDASARALVIAPHQDDETLGCGGTIALKRRAGGHVCIAFVGDGSASHSHLIERDKLQDLRELEALAAAKTLGVSEDDVVFLRVPESRFRQHRSEALERIAALIERERPDEIYMPYRDDPLDDHRITAAVVLDVLRRQGRSIRLYEYPVWLWRTWPWVPLEIGRHGWLVPLWKSTLRMWFGLGVPREFTCAVDVSAVLDVKRAALDKHSTQMRRLLPDQEWWVLADVADGAFLDNFFQPLELFRLSGVAR